MLKLGRLIDLDKFPVVWTVGLGETWWRMFANCVLAVTGADAKEACGTEQLCRRLEAGVKGWVHAVQLLCQKHAQEEDWGFLLVDARKAFNEENRTVMLCAVRHEWPSGAQFTFNCYRHWSTLVIMACGGTDQFLQSKEGVIQGDPWP